MKKTITEKQLHNIIKNVINEAINNPNNQMRQNYQQLEDKMLKAKREFFEYACEYYGIDDKSTQSELFSALGNVVRSIAGGNL